MTTLKLVKQEFFNTNAMRMLLNHNGINDMVKTQLKRYNKHRVNGNRVDNIIYEFKNKQQYGRLYSSMGLATFEKNIRNALAEGIYDDVDMINAHPTILLHECKKYGWVCDKLVHYVNHREEVLKEVASYYNVSRNDAKLLFNVIMFGGSVDTWVKETIIVPMKEIPSFLQDYQNELKTIAINISTFNPDISKFVDKMKKPNKEARVMSYYLQTIEREILFAMIEGFASLNYEVDVPIHDGGLVRRINKDIPLEEAVLRIVENFIQQKTGYTIKLAIKPITSTFVSNTSINPEDYDKLDSMTLDDVRFLEDYNTQKYVFEKYFTKIEAPPCYLKKEFDEIENEITTSILSRKELTEVYANILFIDSDGKQKSFVDYWLLDKNIKTLEKIVFKPPPLQVSQKHFNFWTGYRIEQIDVPSSNNIEPFLTHMNLLCNKNTEISNCAIKVLAHKIQNPGCKIGKALVFIGDEGAGKGIFAEIIKRMFGKKYIHITATPKNDILRNFNSSRLNKLFIFVNEADKKDTHQNISLLKHMITDVEFSLEKKGIDSIPMDCYANFIFFSNEDDCVKFGVNNRRYIVCETSFEIIGNKQYFTEFSEYAKDDRNIKAIYDYLLNLDVSDVSYTMDIPKSATYEKIANETHNIIDLFLENYYLINKFAKSFLVEKPSHLYDQFQLFMEKKYKTDKIMTDKKFGREMTAKVSRYACGVSKQDNAYSPGQAGYIFDIPKMEHYLKKIGLLDKITFEMNDIENTQYSCKQCRLDFDTRKELHEHTRNKHPSSHS